MVSTLTPRPLKPMATGSHDFRVVLHMWSRSTPGPDLPAEKNVARSLIPSGAGISTSFAEDVCADNTLVVSNRIGSSMDRSIGLNLRISLVVWSLEQRDQE